jgi:uncharacterized membrane protein
MNKRILSIDIVRGLVMIIMALDHIRDLLHVNALTQSPTNLDTTTPALFMSRWITHLCAPTFVFLSGVSVYLVTKRTDVANQRGFLLKRGLWLIILEFTIINFLLWFDIEFRILMMQVIAAIGMGFIVLSFLLKASLRLIGIAALIIIFSHNLLQFIPPSSNGFVNVIRSVLFAPGLQQVSPNFMFFISYPLVPWIAIMLLGYSFGKIFEKSEVPRNNTLMKIGIGMILLFVVLRFVNIYGDTFPWQEQKNTLFTILSFVNLTKYPPSLMFVLLFIGIALVLLPLSEKLPRGVQNVLAVYGRVPMFYYLLHWLLIRLSVFILAFAQGFQWSELRFGPFQFGRPESGFGVGLAGVLVSWFLIVAILYPVCKWYSRYKMDHPEKWWLRYL